MPEDVRPFSVLMVCRANLYRSPLAAAFLQAALPRFGIRESWLIRSAGTRAQAGQSLPAATLKVLAERGLAPTQSAAQPLSAELIDQADLVLTVEAEQRRAAVQLNPAGIRRTFLLKQFAELAAAFPLPADPDAPPAPVGHRLVAAAVAARSRIPARGEDDIFDPVGLGHAALRSCANQLQECVDRMLSRVPAASGADPADERPGLAAQETRSGSRSGRRWRRSRDLTGDSATGFS